MRRRTAVTHHWLGQELRKRVFGSLHLERSSFPVDTGRIPGYHAHGYVSTGAVPTPDGSTASPASPLPGCISAGWAGFAPGREALIPRSFTAVLPAGLPRSWASIRRRRGRHRWLVRFVISAAVSLHWNR